MSSGWSEFMVCTESLDVCLLDHTTLSPQSESPTDSHERGSAAIEFSPLAPCAQDFEEQIKDLSIRQSRQYLRVHQDRLRVVEGKSHSHSDMGNGCAHRFCIVS